MKEQWPYVYWFEAPDCLGVKAYFGKEQHGVIIDATKMDDLDREAWFKHAEAELCKYLETRTKAL